MSLRISTGLRNRMLGINPEKLTNTDFETDTTGWTAAATTTLARQSGGANSTSYSMRVTGDGGAGYGYQAITCRNGHVYRLRAYFKKGDGTSGTIRAGTTQAGSELCTKTVTDAAFALHTQYFLVPGTVGSTTIVYIGLHAESGKYHDYDLVSVVSMSRAVQDVFRGGELKFYTGLQPTSADDAPTGTLLVTIKSSTAAGVTWDDAVAGVLSKAAAETWNGVCVATGTAGWCRLQTPSDGGASSTTDERMDLAVGTSGAQINRSSTSFATGATQTLTALTITLPAY